ncbi:MAG TPA: glutamate--tRNA ligase [Candidatus Dormibacteraeota bacterium]|nr:glutamate--tRNA ligase [Candidatus Dormibacteraeota bacterium]
MKTVRTRFAPSPTGFLHLGGLRSALFSYLFAKHHKGAFILRIEDTDRLRLVPEAVGHVQDSLQWLGITPDEGPGIGGEHGPYTQSECLGIYNEHAAKLAEKGDLYPCWCSEERLDDLRKEAQKNKVAFKYDRHCLKHPGDHDKPHVLRFKVPVSPSKIAWKDAVKGRVEFETANLDDFVAVKSDGFPTYHFASVVDDHLMQVSHVLRAEEWVSSTPKHILLYEAFGWSRPEFGHLPQVLGQDKAKLSKRHGAKSALEYRDAGYLPEAVINFLALLGWNEGSGSTKEIYTLGELIKAFTLERVHTAPAIFDQERLEWINGMHIRTKPLNELHELCQAFWPKEAAGYDDSYKKKVLALTQERLKFLAELPELTDFFFAEPEVNTGLLTKQLGRDGSEKLLRSVAASLESSDFSTSDLEQRLRKLAEDEGVKTGQLFGLIRVAITGKTAAPGLFETLHVLGRDVVLKRLKMLTK